MKMLLAVLLVALGAGLAVAQDERIKVTEADFQKLQTLRYQDAVASARRNHARRDKEKLEKIEADQKKALEGAGWTAEQRQAVESALLNAAEYIRLEKVEGEEAGAKEALAAMDATTVATARAHLEELNADLSQKADKQVREEAEAEKRGTPLDPKTLEGTWAMDVEATLDAMGEMIPAGPDREKFKETMRATLPKSSYVFGPGDAVEVRTEEKGGKERTDKGTYRVEGSKIFFRETGRKREHDLDAGMRNGFLQLGKMGAYSLFKRQ